MSKCIIIGLDSLGLGLGLGQILPPLFFDIFKTIYRKSEKGKALPFKKPKRPRVEKKINALN